MDDDFDVRKYDTRINEGSEYQQMIMMPEEEFKDEIKGEIPESDAEKLTTVGQVVEYITGKAAAK